MSDTIQEGSVFFRIKSDATEAKQDVDKLSGSVKNLSNLMSLFKVSAFTAAIRSLGKTVGGFVKQESEFIQTQNLFNKIMGDSIDKATEFRDRMQSELGFDPQQIMGSMSAFQRLSETFGISSDRAYKMSLNLTQLAADMTAYGYSFEDAMQKLKSGLAGEIEPMRAIGVALDRATIQQQMYAMGIDRTYDSLTRAQKTELLYYQIMTQTSKMQGELGRTIISPANALRILQQEFTQLGRAIGSVFIPMMMQIIPVVRAVVQILKEAAEWLAGKFGFKISDYAKDYKVAEEGLDGISDGLDDVGASAGKAAKEMNKMLMPFDELNNINLPTGSSYGGGAGGLGNLGGSLLEDLPGYNIFDTIMGDINGKVDEVKAKIKGMLPVVETLLGTFATLWAIDKIVKFVDWIKRVGAALDTLGAFGGLLEIGFGTLFTITGVMAQYKGLKKILDGDFSIWSILETLGGTALGTFGIASVLRGLTRMGFLNLSLGQSLTIGFGVMLAIASVQTLLDGINTQNVGKELLGMLFAGISGFTIAKGFGATKGWSLTIGVGVTLLAASFTMAKEASVNENQFQAQMQKLLSSAFAGLGGALFAWKAGMGTLILPISILISAASFAFQNVDWEGVTKLPEYLSSGGWSRDWQILWDAYYQEAAGANQRIIQDTRFMSDYIESDLAKVGTVLDNLRESYENVTQSIQESREAKLLDIDIAQALANQLGGLVDANGKVLDKDQERVRYILGELNEALGTEYELVDGVITINDQSVDSYSQVKEAIDETIAARKREIEQEALLALYEESFKNKIALQKDINKQTEQYNTLSEELNNLLANGAKTDSKAVKEKLSNLNTLELGLVDLQHAYEDASNDADYYSRLAFENTANGMTDISNETLEQLGTLSNNAVDTLEESYNGLEQVQENSLKTTNKKFTDYIPSLKSAVKTLASNIPSGFNDNLNAAVTNIKNRLTDMKTSVVQSGVDKSFTTLASSSESKWKAGFEKIKASTSSKMSEVAGVISGQSGPLANAFQGVFNSVNSVGFDTTSLGRRMIDGIMQGIALQTAAYQTGQIIGNAVNKIVGMFQTKLGVHSPSTVMRDEIGIYIPMGIAEGIDKEASVIDESMSGLAERMRLDKTDFDVYSQTDLAAIVSGKINAQTALALANDTATDMANATYDGISRALSENEENPIFNVYVGNDKVYSGYGKQQGRDSNMYGVKV